MIDRTVALPPNHGARFRNHDIGKPSLVEALLNPMGRATPARRPVDRRRVSADGSKLSRDLESVRPPTTIIIFFLYSLLLVCCAGVAVLLRFCCVLCCVRRCVRQTDYLIFVVVTDSCDGDARCGFRCDHCFGFQVAQKPNNFRLFPAPSLRHEADGVSDLPAMDSYRLSGKADTARLPCGLGEKPQPRLHTAEGFALLKERVIPDAAINPEDALAHPVALLRALLFRSLYADATQSAALSDPPSPPDNPHHRPASRRAA
jgi:hypothetical protein